MRLGLRDERAHPPLDRAPVRYCAEAECGAQRLIRDEQAVNSRSLKVRNATAATAGSKNERAE